ncbi:MAG: glycosyltransferase family 39 protein [Isosphaeraceae bacterium]
MSRWAWRRPALLALILASALGTRLWQLGRLSLWYDEVVTMRLARTPGPLALLRLLGEIDATRAPLHPLLLQGWLRLLGTSEAAGRSFSVLCGVLTVFMIARLACRMYPDDATALWAAGLAAVSPLLVVYSREARMYAWLVLVTTFAWDALFALRAPNEPNARRLALYATALAAMVYSHPLGLLMAGTLGMASLAFRRDFGLTWRSWLVVHAAAGLLVAVWLPRFFDHPPESTVGRLPVRFLLGLPIGYLGGNFLTLAVFLGVIAVGLIRDREDRPERVSTSCLLLWLTVPPLILYAYSLVSHPIFGPERYTLYVGPAYLILLGRGLASLPRWPSWCVAALAFGLAAWTLPGRAYSPDLKADWRAAAAYLREADPPAKGVVLVASADPLHNVEVEAARYYLEPSRPVLPLPEPPAGTIVSADAPRVWVAVGVRQGKPVRSLPDDWSRSRSVDLDGLRLFAVQPLSR